MTTHIINQLLLELTFSSIDNSNQDNILDVSLPLYLRKLNCYSVSVHRFDENKIQKVANLPASFTDDPHWVSVTEKIISALVVTGQDVIHLALGEEYCYGYRMNDYGYMVLLRNKPFDHLLKNELVAVIRNLGKILSLRIETEKRINAEKTLLENEFKLVVSGKTEKILRESETRYRSIVENLNQAYYEADRRGIVTFYNPGMLLLSGYNDSELLGTLCYRLVAPETRQQVMDKYKTWMREKRKQMSMEFLVQTKDGRKFWVEQTTNFEFDTEGNFLKAYNILRDIDERKQAENALRRRLEFEELIDSISSRFINAPTSDLNPIISDSLKEVGIMSGVDRCRLSMFSADHQSFSVTHEWCRQGVTPQLENMQNVPATKISWATKQLLQSKIINIPAVNDLPDEAENEKHLLKQQGINSLLAISVEVSGRLVGYLGFASDAKSKHWDDTDLIILQLLAKIFSNFFERKKSEASLMLQSSALNAAANGIVITGRDGTIEWVNMAFTELTGFSHDEVIGQNPRILNSGLQDQSFYGNLWNFIKAGKVWKGELINKRKDGSIYIEEQTITPVRNNEGAITHFIGIKHNITDRKASEQALMESEKKYRNFYEQDLTGDYQVAMDGTIMDCNPAFARMMGYESVSEILKINVREFYPNPRERESFIEMMEKKKILTNYEIDLLKKDGNVITCVENLVGKFDEHGKLTEYLGYMYDISEQKKAESALRQNEQLLSSIMDTQTDLVCRYLPDTTLTFVNKAYCRAIGRSEEEVINQKFLAFVPDNEWASILQKLASLNVLKPQITFTNTATMPDGKEIQIEWTDQAIFNAQGEVIEYQSVGHDVTEKLIKEQELINAKEKAEAGDKLKTAFLNNISHEIRTPLNGILGFGQLVMQNDLTPQEKKEHLGYLEKSIERLLSTVTDYLDISMIATGQMRCKPDRFPANEFIQKLYEKYFSECESKNLQLIAEIPELEKQAILTSDFGQLFKAFSHLMNNAVKFTNTGMIRVGYRLHGSELELYIKDTGIGISDDKLESVLQAFSQEETGYTRNYEGSGLGLSIAKGILDLMGSKLKLDSLKGEGTCVYASLPFKFEEKKAEVNTQPIFSPNGESAPLVLIAEDDQANYLYLSILLKKIGAKTSHAKNGAEAVDLCKSNQGIKLVLMDIKMPVMDGLEATKLVKEFYPELPVIAVTAFSQQDDEEKIRQAGCDEFLTKPVSLVTLKEIFRRYIKRP